MFVRCAFLDYSVGSGKLLMNNIPQLSKKDKERFMIRVVEGMSDDDCWQWTGKKYRTGRGMFFIDRIVYYAPRISYSLFVGKIPAGMLVLHKCDNPNCVNPKHLFTGTQTQNIQDRDSKGRNRSSHKFCVNGHEFTHENTRRYGPSNKYRMCRTCAKENMRAYRKRTRWEAENY
jgi:hypothetical protein